MARIRTIKPEFFTSEDIVNLTPLARLLYIAIWCESDKEGRLQWKPMTFKLRYFPGDNCDIHAMCKEIVDAGLVKLYGEGLAVIPSFKAHQHINPRESDSQLPEPVEIPTRKSRVGTRQLRDDDAQGGREGKGKEGKEGDGTEPPGDSPQAAPYVVSIPLIDKTEHGISQVRIDEWSQAYPAVDVAQKLREMRQWCLANPANKKTPKGVEAFIVRWLAKEQDKGGRAGAGHASQEVSFV